MYVLAFILNWIVDVFKDNSLPLFIFSNLLSVHDFPPQELLASTEGFLHWLDLQYKCLVPPSSLPMSHRLQSSFSTSSAVAGLVRSLCPLCNQTACSEQIDQTMQWWVLLKTPFILSVSANLLSFRMSHVERQWHQNQSSKQSHKALAGQSQCD